MRFLSDSASYADHQAPDSAVLRGLGALSTDIEELTQRVKELRKRKAKERQS
jgi:hypothetical protein